MPALYILYYRISIYFFYYFYIIKYLYFIYLGYLGLYLLSCFFLFMDPSLDVSILIGWDTNFSEEFLYMDGPHYNVDSLTGEGSNGGTPGGGPGNNNNNNDIAFCTTDGSDKRVRRVNPMSLTQICGPSVPDIPAPTPEHIEPLDNESLKKVVNVLSDEKEEYLKNYTEKKSHCVTLSELGYNFKASGYKYKEPGEGAVISELFQLKKTEPNLKNISGATNVDKVIFYCLKK